MQQIAIFASSFQYLLVRGQAVKVTYYQFQLLLTIQNMHLPQEQSVRHFVEQTLLDMYLEIHFQQYQLPLGLNQSK